MHFFKKLAKWCAILIAILIPGMILASIAALFLIDSHHFKPQLIQITEKKLGRKLVINGDFSLQIYPNIGIRLTQTHLKNPASFGEFKDNDFAYVNSAKLKIELLPLLKGKVQIEELQLEGLKLNLTRLSSTQDNWSDLVTQFKKNPEEEAESDEDENEDENGNLSKGKFKLNLYETSIDKAVLHYEDKPTKKIYLLNDLNFYTKKLSLNKPSDIKGDFTFIADELHTQMAYQGKMIFNRKKNQLELSPLSLKSSFISQKLPGGKFASELTGNLKADWKNQTFDLSSLILKFNDSVAKGSANLDFSTGLSARFNLGINTLALDKYLPDTHLTLNTIQTHGVFSNQILNLSTLKANLYQGSFQGSSKITFKQQNLYQVNGKFSQVNIQALLSALKNINKISGTSNASVNLSTSGHQSTELKRNLSGQVTLEMLHGYLYGFDLAYYLNQAHVLAKRLPHETQLVDNQKTPFDQLTGLFVFQNGVISNQNLQGRSNFYELTGMGTIDLVKEFIQYQLKATTLRADGSKRKIPLAVIITGPLSSPKIRPDIEAYIKTFFQEQLEKQLNKQLEKKLGITLDSGSSNDSGNSTDKKALQKDLINKGLQKLFGK